MKTLTALVLICLFVGVGSIAAQSGQNGVSESSPRSETVGKKIVMVGCVYAQDDKYLLFSYKQSGGVELRSDQDLKAHLGQKVKIHGTMLNASSGSGGSNAERNADDQAKQEKHVVSHEPENGPLQVSKITMLSQSCDKRYRESAEKQLGKQNL
jgi:hypothetical protein